MKEAAVELVKSVPPVTVGTMTWIGISLSDVTLVLTAVYTTCLLYVLLRDKIVGPWLDRRRTE
jgi:hypothetical protein